MGTHMYRRILVAVDGSRSSKLALEQAILVASACGASIKVLFVLDDNGAFYFKGEAYPSWLLQSLFEMGRKALEDASAQLIAAHIPHSTNIVDTPLPRHGVAALIEKEAATWHADLIVLGTHGRRGVKRLVMGSVAEGVVRLSHRPVLLARDEKDD